MRDGKVREGSGSGETWFGEEIGGKGSLVTRQKVRTSERKRSDSIPTFVFYTKPQTEENESFYGNSK